MTGVISYIDSAELYSFSRIERIIRKAYSKGYSFPPHVKSLLHLPIYVIVPDFVFQRSLDISYILSLTLDAYTLNFTLEGEYDVLQKDLKSFNHICFNPNAFSTANRHVHTNLQVQCAPFPKKYSPLFASINKNNTSCSVYGDGRKYPSCVALHDMQIVRKVLQDTIDPTLPVHIIDLLETLLR